MPGTDVHDEDDLDELPPLDGELRDAPDDEPDYTDLLEDAPGEATLDDATAEDDPADPGDLDLDAQETGWLDDAGEAADLDLGPLAVIEFANDASLLDEADEPSDDEDFAFGDAPERGGLDGGEEGPVDADEELREADLPALDADEDGDLDDATLVDPAFASDEPLGLPWAAAPWARVGSPMAFAGATAVACAGRGALVVGRLEGRAAGLARVDLEGACEPLPAQGLNAAGVRALAAEERVVAALVQGGRVFVSTDDGARFEPAAEPIGDGIAVSDVAMASGRLWACTRGGGLLVHHSVGAGPARDRDARPAGPQPTIERCPVPGVAIALTRDAAGARLGGGAGVAVLVADDGGRPTALVRCDESGGVHREIVDGPEARAPALVAVRGAHAAYPARRGGVVRRLDGGPWATIEWEGCVTALVFIDDEGTLACATYSDADDTTAFVRVDASGVASVVARVGAASPDADSDGRVAAMAYDEARGVVWVVGGFGLAVFAVK